MKKAKVTVAQSIVDSILAHSIDQVFCVPGESYLPILDALYEEEAIQVISARHEGAAAMMAEAYAKSSLKAGILLATRGVGASNASIGIHTALQDSTPMIFLIGQVHRKFRHKEAFQEIDLVEFFRPITKWAVELTDAARIHEIMQRAFRIAMTGRPGPVVISLPEDLLIEQVTSLPYAKLTLPKPAPSKAEIKRLATLLQRAKRPVLIAGGGVGTAQAQELLHELSERFNLPTFVSFRRHHVFSHQSRQYVGHLGFSHPDYLQKAFAEADLIISLASRLSEITTGDYRLIKAEQSLIQVDIQASVLGQSFEPSLGIVACARSFIQQLLKQEIQSNWDEWTHSLRQAYLQRHQQLAREDPSINNFIIQTLQEKLGKPRIVTNDAGNFASWLHELFFFEPGDYYLGPTSGAMGYALPAAIGAKLAHPELRAVALAGDGGFMMTVQELETAVRYQIPVICLVFNNRMYGTIRMHQEMNYPGREIGTNLTDISFQQLAESLGAKGYTVESQEDFLHVIDEVLAEDQVSVIDIKTDPKDLSIMKRLEDLDDESLR